VIAGVDEVGRGSWAGPVVAAAVVLPLEWPDLCRALDGVRDSKQLSAERREELFQAILSLSSAIGIGWSTHHVVDRMGIAAANRRAMERAVARLSVRPDALLLDYFELPSCSLPQRSVPQGDARSLSIACASIVAKVVRDRWMQKCDARFPGYGFGQHKGYGTPQHRAALEEQGPSPLHRLSFRPLSGWEP
jgi:ribonuclease HII